MRISRAGAVRESAFSKRYKKGSPLLVAVRATIGLVAILRGSTSTKLGGACPQVAIGRVAGGCLGIPCSLYDTTIFDSTTALLVTVHEG